MKSELHEFLKTFAGEGKVCCVNFTFCSTLNSKLDVRTLANYVHQAVD